MIVIGVTGSIGMGKSTISQMLREMSIPVYDADTAVHRMLAAQGSAVTAVGQKFPAALKTNAAGDNYIDRKALGALVFNNPSQKKELEDILHPLVWMESEQFISNMKQEGHAVIVLDVPLLFESGEDRLVDIVLCVSAAAETQRRRVMARPGMTAEIFNRIVAGQMPDAEKRQRADFVVDTDKGLEDTRQQLQDIIARLTPPTPPFKNAPQP